MKASYSVAIVGAGPAGLVLANLLGKAGLDVLVVETRASTVSEPRAVSIDDESLRVMQAIGLLDIVQSGLVQGYGSEYRSPRGRTFLKVKPQSEPYGHPRRNAFRQPVFEAQLRTGLEFYPNVDMRFGCSLLSFRQDEAGVTLRVAQEGQQEVETRAAYLIGCDGAHSRVRQDLGIELTGTSMDERWLIVDLEDSPATSSETIVFCDARRPAIALPGPHQTRRFEFKLLDHEDDQRMLAPDHVAALLESHGVAAGSRIVRTTIYHFHARVAERWGRGRVWLAGDAAHLTPPFAGQGMNSGVRDACNLAWKLTQVIRGRMGPGLIATYEEERRGHVWDMIRLALRMGSIMAPRTPAHGLATRLLFDSLGVWPKARSYFAEMKYKPPPRFEHGFLLASGASERGGLLGRMIPQPRIDAGDGERRPLDDLLGDGFALVGIGLDDAVAASAVLGAAWQPLVTRRMAVPIDAAPDLTAYAGRLLLLRPDRYVMAESPPEEWPRTARALDAILSETWRPAR
jgi:3-(3-hydroxy-phenyl)propionate hydroxylase